MSRTNIKFSSCVICGRQIVEEENVSCSICGALMHKSCANDEVLLDQEENYLCPYDAMLAALDWFDGVITTYVSVLNEEQKNDVLSRLKSYVNLLSENFK